MKVNLKKQRIYQREHYKKNRVHRRSLIVKQEKKIKDYVIASKDGKLCMDCSGKFPPYVMDYDHRDPTTKICNPCEIFTKGWGLKKVQEELDKCDLICANCHRERTFGKV